MGNFAGIDIAKRVHWMAVTDSEGRIVMEPRAYANDSEGLSRMVSDLDSLGCSVVVGMESTGCYWRSCWRALVQAGYGVSVINPVVTCAERRQRNLGRAKTDSVDCIVIADTVRKKGLTHTAVSDGDAVQLRDLGRFRRSLSESLTSVKLRIIGLLDQVWPEYSRLFSDVFGSGSLVVLRDWGLPGSPSCCGVDALAVALSDATRGRFGVDKALEVEASSLSTCGVPANDAHHLQLSILLDQADSLRGQLAQLDSAASALLASVAPTLCTVPGIGPALAAQIAAEIGDVSRFPDPKALCAYAGLDPRRFQSGGYESERSRISKRGSVYLRRSLYIAAQAALRADCEFRDFYDRQRARGRSHKYAVCAVARKMLCVVWALMCTGEEYDPERHRGNK